MISPIEALSNPQMLHAIVVHIPVALGVLGVPLAVAAAFVADPKRIMTWVALAAYVLMIAASLVALETGENARDHIPGDPSQAALKLADEHEEYGEKVWMFAALTSALLLAGFIKKQPLRRNGMLLAVVASLATGGWIAMTGHYGGNLVYAYGVGTPNPRTDASASAPTIPPAVIPAAPARGERETGQDVDDNRPAALAMPQVIPTPAGEDNPKWVAIRPIEMAEAAKVSYARDVEPIFKENCYRCHTPGRRGPSGHYDMSTVAQILAGGEHAHPAVIPGQPDKSPMVEYLRGIRDPQMPRRRPPLTPAKLHLIREWIATGAVDDSPATTATVTQAN